jgi:glycosyltransferase involved in cell wall biosynthesis
MDNVTEADSYKPVSEDRRTCGMTETAETPISKRRLNVLFIPQWYPSIDGSNAVGTFCREHVRAASLYDNVAVLVFGSRRQSWPTLHWERVNDAGVPTFYATHGHSPIPKTSWLVFQIQLRRALRRVIAEWGRPDVIHTQDAYAYYVIKAVHDLGIPFVISQHWDAVSRRVLDPRTVRQFRWAFARASRVLAANQFTQKDYDHYRFQASMVWLPNTLDPDVVHPPMQSKREPWLLHASGFESRKRFPDIVKAFSRVRPQRPNAVLQVVGDGKNRAEMEVLAAHELPHGSFHFHGYLPTKRHVVELMHRARGLLLPSDAESFGCVLMEAMACECPVLTTRVGGIPAVVREGEGLFVEVGNIDRIAEGMIRLLDGTHGLDLQHISRETRERFSLATVGRLLHEEHFRAANTGPRCEDAKSVSPLALSNEVK